MLKIDTKLSTEILDDYVGACLEEDREMFSKMIRMNFHSILKSGEYVTRTAEYWKDGETLKTLPEVLIDMTIEAAMEDMKEINKSKS